MNTVINRFTPGRRIAICGRAGSGKTTILNAIRELMPNGNYNDDYIYRNMASIRESINVYCIQSVRSIPPAMRGIINFWIFTSRHAVVDFIRFTPGIDINRVRELLYVFDHPYRVLYYDRFTDEFLI
jgi:ABC-type multidrug transport system ATPase subunit